MSFAANEPKNIWTSIPFFEGGDLGQYTETVSKSRDSVRKQFWKDLMSEANKLAERNIPVEKMIGAMANIMLSFDQVHDVHKAKDVINVDYSLEQQFKASFDALFTHYGITDRLRKVQISSGPDVDYLTQVIQNISKEKALGQKLSSDELTARAAFAILNNVDYIAYGTFSSLGRGYFQVTFHIQGSRDGATKNFMARGPLVTAVDDLAQQVFDFFQKNSYQSWETPQPQLEWIPMPINDERLRQMQMYNSWEAYTYTEAKNYCQARGYRLPYSRELLLAESGGPYFPGGISNLKITASYAIADKRNSTDNTWYVSAYASSTGGPFMYDNSYARKGIFWCVKGAPASDVLFLENVWSLLRKYRNVNLEVYRALETVRAGVGDFDTGEKIINWNGNFVTVKLMTNMQEALSTLRRHGIPLKVPANLKP